MHLNSNGVRRGIRNSFVKPNSPLTGIFLLEVLMQETVLINKLYAELEVNKLGEHRKFKFINEHLKDDQKTIDFLVDFLGYKRWQANQIAYSIQHRKNAYHKKKLILRQ